MNFKNKVVIITGSSQGIGKALAQQLGRRGARVVLNARNPEKLSLAARELQSEGLEVIALQGDVSQAETCSRLVAETLRTWGQIDILVNNVGVSVATADIDEVRPEVYSRVAEINYLSAVYMTVAALKPIQKSGGAILFVSSIAGLSGFPGNAAYCSAKMALTGFAESLRWELMGSGVSVGIAYVGFTENVPGKMVLAPEGGTTLKVHVNPVKLVPIERVARQLVRMLERRRFKVNFTFPGKILAGLLRYFPGIARAILRPVFRRRQIRARHTKTASVEMTTVRD